MWNKHICQIEQRNSHHPTYNSHIYTTEGFSEIYQLCTGAQGFINFVPLIYMNTTYVT